MSSSLSNRATLFAQDAPGHVGPQLFAGHDCIPSPRLTFDRRAILGRDVAARLPHAWQTGGHAKRGSELVDAAHGGYGSFEGGGGGGFAHGRECSALTIVNASVGLITSVKTLAERLADARAQKKWSQAKLAVEAKVAIGTIGNLEAGSRKQPRGLLAIAKALGVEPEWLASGRGPRIVSAAKISPAPAAPSPDFQDRKWVDNSDWALLQAARVAMTDDERAALLKRHAMLKAQARDELESAKK